MSFPVRKSAAIDLVEAKKTAIPQKADRKSIKCKRKILAKTAVSPLKM